MIRKIPLKVGSYYYFKERGICHENQITEWVIRLDRYKASNNIIFDVLITNNKDFCNPGINMADIKCTTEYFLFESSTCIAIKEIKKEDILQYFNFKLLVKNYCSGKGRIYYDTKLIDLLPFDKLPLLLKKAGKIRKILDFNSSYERRCLMEELIYERQIKEAFKEDLPLFMGRSKRTDRIIAKRLTEA